MSLLELDDISTGYGSFPGPLQRQPAHRGGRDARHHRRQRRRQVHLAPNHLRAAAHRQRQGSFRRPAHRSDAPAQAREPGHLLRARRPLGLPQPDRAREPPGGGALPPHRACGPRQGLRALPAAVSPAAAPGSAASPGESSRLWPSAGGSCPIPGSSCSTKSRWVSLRWWWRRSTRLCPPSVASGTTVLLVEQDVGQAMKFADRVACMLEGRIVLDGTPSELSHDDIAKAYFGV